MLEVQEALNTGCCKRLEIPALDFPFEDPDVSGSIPFIERQGGRASMNPLAQGDVKHLVTAKQDRLGRDTLDTIATQFSAARPHENRDNTPLPAFSVLPHKCGRFH